MQQDAQQAGECSQEIAGIFADAAIGQTGQRCPEANVRAAAKESGCRRGDTGWRRTRFINDLPHPDLPRRPCQQRLHGLGHTGRDAVAPAKIRACADVDYPHARAGEAPAIRVEEPIQHPVDRAVSTHAHHHIIAGAIGFLREHPGVVQPLTKRQIVLDPAALQLRTQLGQLFPGAAVAGVRVGDEETNWHNRS